MASCNKNIRLVNFLEDVLESAIVFLQDGVLGGQELTTPIIKAEVKKTERVNVPAAFFRLCHLKRRVGETRNRLSRAWPSTTSQKKSKKEQGQTSLVLYIGGGNIARATPFPLKSYTFDVTGSPPPSGVNTSWSFPGPGARKSVAQY
jgi:hypothetical protein